ncbi:MAG: hypothetical protein AAGB03_02535 [Pseudomonadota bacterium]
MGDATAHKELEQILAREISTALGQEDCDLSRQRRENLDYYLGEKFGNEQQGRSQVVSSDVADTIEWILPHLMRIFSGGGRSVVFEPRHADDEAFADQATDFVNHIWNRENNGFLTFYTWFKDALLAKNGFVKVWWQANTERSREHFDGLTEEGLMLLEADPDLDILSRKKATDTEHETDTWNVEGIRSRAKGQIRVAPVPPEEFLISRNASSIEAARFVAHRVRRSLSSLVEEGYPIAVLEKLASAQTDFDEASSRNTLVNEVEPGDLAGLNPAMREVWITEAYVRFDADGDGIAEMRQVVCAGDGTTILRNEPWHGPRPFVSLTAIPMPHRFFGRAVADLIKDIQLIKSTILRQYLDGLYLANNPRHEAVEANIVDPSELLVSRPGGVVRVREPGSIRPLQTDFVGAAALEGLGYIDQVRENRTGVSPRTTGLGENPLHQTATGERLLLTAAQGKIELIARIFAETGVREAFRLILWLAVNHVSEPAQIPAQEAWRFVDPRQWPADMDVSVAVGLGAGSRDEQIQNAMTLLQLQREAIGFGMVSPENFHASASMLVQAMGLKDVNRFFSVQPAPGSAPNGGPQPPQAGPEGPLAGGDQQAEPAIADMARLQGQQVAADIEHKLMKLEQEFALKREEMHAKLALEREKFDLELAFKREMEKAKQDHEKELALAKGTL